MGTLRTIVQRKLLIVHNMDHLKLARLRTEQKLIAPHGGEVVRKE